MTPPLGIQELASFGSIPDEPDSDHVLARAIEQIGRLTGGEAVIGLAGSEETVAFIFGSDDVLHDGEKLP